MRIAMLGDYPLAESHIVGGPQAVVMSLLQQFSTQDDIELHVLTCRPITNLTGPNQPPSPTHHTYSPTPLPNQQPSWTSPVGSFHRPVYMDDAGAGQPDWTVHTLPRKRFGRITLHWRERRALATLLRRLAPDVVHAQAIGLYAAAALDTGLPAVATVHGIGFREAQLQAGWSNQIRGALDSWFERRCLRRAQHLISISPYVQSEFAAITAAHVYAIENPIDARFFSVRPAPVPGRILFVGRIIARKAVHDLVAAVARLADDLPHVHLHLAGEVASEPEYVATVRQTIATHKLGERVSFLGSLSTAELADAYSQAACVALPSRQETAPVVIEEAMAARLAVVATPVGGVPHMIAHERNGLLAPVDDVTALTDQLRRLLTDQALCQRLGQAAQETARMRFHPRAVANKTLDVYARIMESAQHG